MRWWASASTSTSTRRSFGAGLLLPATSLSHLLWAARWTACRCCGPCCALVERRYLALQAGHSPQAEWAARLVTLGHAVRVSAGDRVLEGLAEAVDADGALLLRLADGRAGDGARRRCDPAAKMTAASLTIRRFPGILRSAA